MTIDYNTIIRRLENRFVPTAISQHAHQQMQEALISSQAGLKPKIIILAGSSGTGKSQLVKAFIAQKRNNTLRSDSGRKQSIAYCELEAGSSAKGFVDTVLDSLNIAYEDRATTKDKRKLLLASIKNLGLSLLIIDESQQTIEYRSRGIQNAYLDAIKRLSEQARIAIVLAGTLSLLDASVVNHQVTRRADRPIVLNRPDFSNQIERADFSEMIKALLHACEQIKFPDLLDPPTVWRMYCASCGVIGQVAHILERCVLNCRLHGTTVVSTEDMVMAANQAIPAFPLDGTNPFSPEFNIPYSKSILAKVLDFDNYLWRAGKKGGRCV